MHFDLVNAAHFGYHEVVFRLLEEGVDVNRKDGFEWTALLYAAYHGHLLVVEALLRADANVNYEDKHKRTALYYAMEKDRFPVVSALLRVGATARVGSIPRGFVRFQRWIAISLSMPFLP